MAEQDAQIAQLIDVVERLDRRVEEQGRQIAELTKIVSVGEGAFKALTWVGKLLLGAVAVAGVIAAFLGIFKH